MLNGSRILAYLSQRQALWHRIRGAGRNSSDFGRGAPLMAGFGAERKHVTLPTDFRSPRENGHSRYGHLTARFAPFLPLAGASLAPSRGLKAAIP